MLSSLQSFSTSPPVNISFLFSFSPISNDTNMPYISRFSRQHPAQVHRYRHPIHARRDRSPLGLPEDSFFKNDLMPNGPDSLDQLPTNQHGALPFPNPSSHIEVQR